MTLCEMTMFPTDKGASVSPWVARILDIIDQSGLEYQLTPMGTILEGEWTDIMTVVTGCFRALEPDCERISVSIHIDHRSGPERRMRKKVATIESLLGRPLSS